MKVEVAFIFDGDGWVLPVLSIDGKLCEPAADAIPIDRADEAALIEQGIDPLDVRRRWDERGS